MHMECELETAGNGEVVGVVHRLKNTGLCVIQRSITPYTYELELLYSHQKLIIGVMLTAKHHNVATTSAKQETGQGNN